MNAFNGKQVRQLCKALDISTEEFWQRLGVPYVIGRGYENGTAMPQYLQTLIAVAYGDNPDAAVAELRAGLKAPNRVPPYELIPL